MADVAGRSLSGSFLAPEKVVDPDSPLQKAVYAVSQEALQYRTTLRNAIHPMERGLGEYALQALTRYEHQPGEHKPVLNAMLKHFRMVSTLSGSSDITLDGIEVLTKFHEGEQKDLLLADAAKKYAAENFQIIDLNSDGTLHYPELLNNKETAAGDEKVLATYLLEREVDIAGLSPDADRGFLARNTEIERGIARDDLKAMTATAMTDAMIANHYLKIQLSGRKSLEGKAYGMWNGSYYDGRDHADVRAFLKAVPGSLVVNNHQRN